MRILGVNWNGDLEYTACTMIDDKFTNIVYNDKFWNIYDLCISIYSHAKREHVDIIVVDGVGMSKHIYDVLKNIAHDIEVKEKVLSSSDIHDVLKGMRCMSLLENIPLYVKTRYNGLLYLNYDNYTPIDAMKVNAMAMAYSCYLDNKQTIENSKQLKHKDITPQHDEVNIYFGYKDKNDLSIKIDGLVEVFNEDIINDLFIDKDEKVAHITTFREVTQDEINGLFYIFDTNNIKINNLVDALWINIDDVL